MKRRTGRPGWEAAAASARTLTGGQAWQEADSKISGYLSRIIGVRLIPPSFTV
jgi:hypothetical protein